MIIDHQIDDEMILRDEVSDEALEVAACVALGGLPTIMYRTYCFACPSDPLHSYSAPIRPLKFPFKTIEKCLGLPFPTEGHLMPDTSHFQIKRAFLCRMSALS